MSVRTWEQQKAYEAASRKRWLESVAAMGVTKAEAARHAGIERGNFSRMLDHYGVHCPTRKEITQSKRDAERQEREEAASKARAERAARATLARQKAEFLSQGMTEQQALRAIADELGVRL